jgi:putative DNA primase/helicase
MKSENQQKKSERRNNIMEKGIFKKNWRFYQERGLTPYPASKTYKGPIVDWKYDENGEILPPPCSDDYLEWEEKYPDANIWVLLGDEWAVIDPDCEEAEKFVQSLNLPKCPTSISGNKSVHRWFRLSTPIKPITIENPNGTGFLDLRTGDQGMLVPPSIHPVTKKPYRWMEGYEL